MVKSKAKSAKNSKKKNTKDDSNRMTDQTAAALELKILAYFWNKSQHGKRKDLLIQSSEIGPAIKVKSNVDVKTVLEKLCESTILNKVPVGKRELFQISDAGIDSCQEFRKIRNENENITKLSIFDLYYKAIKDTMQDSGFKI
tara:strand:- start:1358 stop:1786 length:429 start_codon:yes stop_codon:yes gene_type:complete